MRGKLFLIAALCVGAIAVAACSSSSAVPTSNDGHSYDQAARLQPTSAAAESQAPNPAASGAGATSGAGLAAPEDRIVKTGSVDIQVTGIDDSVARATDQIHALGGWLAGSNRTTSTASGMASVTFRVPAARFEDALAAMRKLGTKVLGEHSDSTSVGSQIVDLQARIDNLKASEKAVQAIMDKASTVADVLTVEQRLAEVQGQIEELTAQTQGLTDQSAYSTLTVIFEAPASDTASPTASPSASAVAWSAREDFLQAAGTLGGVGQGATTIAIWLFVVVLPLSLAMVLLVAALALLARLLQPLWRRWPPVVLSQPKPRDPSA
jgi:hypothetical protein